MVLNDIAVSWGHDGVERVVLESLEEIAYGRLRTDKKLQHRPFEGERQAASSANG